MFSHGDGFSLRDSQRQSRSPKTSSGPFGAASGALLSTTVETRETEADLLIPLWFEVSGVQEVEG